MTVPPGEGTLETSDGAQVFYRVVGEGPVALYAHPFQNPTMRVAEVIPYRHQLTCVLPYPRGMARSSASRQPSDLGMARMVDDLEELRQHLGVERWLIHGRSEGGFLGLLYAARYPQAVAGLILFATAPSYRYLVRQEGLFDPQHPGFALLNMTLWRFLADPSDRHFTQYWAARARILNEARARALGQALPPSPPWNAQSLPPLRTDGEIAQGAAQRYHRFLLEILDYDVRPILPTLEVPALIVAGRHDPYCTPDQSEELAALLPQSDLVILDNAAHAVSMDAGEEVEAAVGAFLVRHGFSAS